MVYNSNSTSTLRLDIIVDPEDNLDYVAEIAKDYLYDIINGYKQKKPKMILPEIIYEPKNNIYVAVFPDGKKEIDILKPNHGDEYDLEKGLLYYIIKNNLDLGKVLEWMRPILDTTQHPKYIEKHQKQLQSKINKWFVEKNDISINDKECQKLIDNMNFTIENQEYYIEINIHNNGIVSIYDKKTNESIPMIKDGFPVRGFLRHLIYKLYREGDPSLEYYQLKKLTYKFYKGCFDSIEKKCK